MIPKTKKRNLHSLCSLKTLFLESQCVYGFLQTTHISQASLPHLNNAVPRGSHDEALRGLEGGDVRDDVVVAHGQGLRAPPRAVVTRPRLLLVLNLLCGG